MKPNILFIIVHDLGQHMEIYGNTSVRTPNLHRLAEEGVSFENYFATAPQCSPSRASIYTGKYPHTHGLMGLANRDLDWSLSTSEKTTVQLLRQSGYFTCLFGLQHESQDPHSLGFDEIVQPEGESFEKYYCHRVAPVVLEFLRHPKSKPFYANVGFLEVHRPYPQEVYQPDDPNEVLVPPYLPDTPEVRQDIAEFHGSIRKVDRAVGSIFDTLKETGLEEETLVVFTTDHGIAFPRAKCTLYDPGIKTTLIMRWPDGGVIGGKVYSELLSNVDFLPTILEVVKAPVPEDIQGKSFLPLLQDGKFEPRKEIFAEKTWHIIYDPMRCIRTSRYKYIRNFIDGPLLRLPGDMEKSLSRKSLGKTHLKPRPEEELYDLRQDPNEQNNLAGKSEYSEIQTKLSGRLIEWMKKTKDPVLEGQIPIVDGWGALRYARWE